MRQPSVISSAGAILVLGCAGLSKNGVTIAEPGSINIAAISQTLINDCAFAILAPADFKRCRLSVSFPVVLIEVV